MADSEDIIHGIFILLKGCSRGYVTNENAEQVCRKHAKIIRQIDGDFSCLRKVESTRERIREAGYFVAASMKTYHNLELSATPKAHIF